MIRRHLVVTGRVQNVFYRSWMVEQATALGLDGWVRNRANGSVEALVDGPAESVATVIDRCRSGPPAARVADVVAVEVARDELLDGFEERATL